MRLYRKQRSREAEQRRGEERGWAQTSKFNLIQMLCICTVYLHVYFPSLCLLWFGSALLSLASPSGQSSPSSLAAQVQDFSMRQSMTYIPLVLKIGRQLETAYI